MGVADSAKEVGRSLPDYFYDAIVYYASSVLLWVSVSLLLCDAASLKALFGTSSAGGKLMISFGGLGLMYITGQLSSAFSNYLIKKPVSWIAKRWSRKKADFFFDRPELLEPYALLKQHSEKIRGNYWTIIYALKIKCPSIGGDLIKRYARVKLARSNALNMIAVAVASLVTFLATGVGFESVLAKAAPLWAWAIVFGGLAFVFGLEFYIRQCWFGDIVVKIAAAADQAGRET